MVISEHPASEYAVIGTRPIRHDGLDKVTGRAVYGADIHLAGLVYGAVLRSPYPHARIVSIDTSKAEAAPGVLAVMTGADVPRYRAGCRPGDGERERWSTGGTPLRRSRLRA